MCPSKTSDCCSRRVTGPQCPSSVVRWPLSRDLRDTPATKPGPSGARRWILALCPQRAVKTGRAEPGSTPCKNFGAVRVPGRHGWSAHSGFCLLPHIVELRTTLVLHPNVRRRGKSSTERFPQHCVRGCMSVSVGCLSSVSVSAQGQLLFGLWKPSEAVIT